MARASQRLTACGSSDVAGFRRSFVAKKENRCWSSYHVLETKASVNIEFKDLGTLTVSKFGRILRTSIDPSSNTPSIRSMATKRFVNARPGRRRTEPIMPFDEDLYSSSEDNLTSRGANDRRLRQAISYLATEGGADSPALYIDRVQRIYDGIIQQYPEEGYPFDVKLYEQLRSMVREVQNDFQRVAEEDSSIDLDDSLASIEELPSPEALYRGEDEHDFDPQPPAGRLAAPRRFSHTSSAKEPIKRNFSVTHEFRYGGPNNEVEEWHREFPAILPFGETLYMQEWESMKINYDLRESAKKSADDADAVVTTNVPYDAVEANFHQNSHYDSGSRFKLPKILDHVWARVSDVVDRFPFAKAVETFNQGGDPKEQEKKDYAPRVFLPQVSMPAKRSSTSLPKDLAEPSAAPIAKPTPSRLLPKAPRRPSKASKIGTVNPDVLPILAQHSQRAEPAHEHASAILDEIDGIPSDLSEPSIAVKRPRAPMPKVTLKKFREARAIAAKKPSPAFNERTHARARTPSITRTRSASATSARVTKPSSKPRPTPPRKTATPTGVTKPSPKAQSRTPPATRRLNHVAVGSSRDTPGSYRRSEPTPASPAVTRAATRAGKRKLTEADDSYAKTTKKARVGKKTATKKKAAAERKTVAFANNDPLYIPEPSPTETVMSTKSAVEKSVAKKPIAKKKAVDGKVKKATTKKARVTTSLPGLVSKKKKATTKDESVLRGTTRSGRKFKPASKGRK